MKQLLLAALLISVGVSGAMLARSQAAAQSGAVESRQTEITVTVTEQQWWLSRWEDNSIACVVSVEKEGLPAAVDVLLDCGESLYQEWLATPPCEAVESGGNVKSCQGLYLVHVGQTAVEKSLVVQLPEPSVWLSLQGCSPEPPLSSCAELPTLVFTGEEPLPNEAVIGVHVLINGELVDCAGARCEIPLRPTSYEGEEIVFWADSSYGDESEHFTARIRVVDAGVTSDPDAGNWYVDVISSQWRGFSTDSCAAMWEAFPPVGELPEWLSTPSDYTGLASDTPFVFLAGELIRTGVVDASACVDQGLMGNGAASPCGVEAARSIVNDWQDQFDADIYATAVDHNLPAQLLKNLFAQESQFWPGETVEKEFGFGQLTADGADTTLLWNTDFYNQFCPLVLHADACSSGYAFLSVEEQEVLRGALATQSSALCSTCAAGIDLAHARSTIDVFAETMVANCAQVSFIVSDVTGEMPGVVSDYEDLWKFTLANYNAGPSCLAKAVNQAWGQRVLDWPSVSAAFSQGCAAAVDYVDRVTRDRAPADPDFLPTPTPTITPYFTPGPGSTPAPTATPEPPSGYPPPPTSTTNPGGYPPPQPTSTPVGYP